MATTKIDTYGEYVPSPAIPPVPGFPCPENPACTQAKPICTRHTRVLTVKVLKNTGTIPSEFQIPFGRWEDWEWYSERIQDVIGLDGSQFRMIFAGCERRPGDSRHSGLQNQSTIHCIIKTDS